MIYFVKAIKIDLYYKILGWQKCGALDTCEWDGKEDWDFVKDHYYIEGCHSE